MNTRAKRSAGEGGIRTYTRRDGSELWEINYPEPLPTGEIKRKFKRGFPDEQTARDALSSALVHIREGDYQRETRDTISDYGREYLEGLRLKPSTLAGYRRHFRVHVEPALGRKKISKLTKLDLNKLYRAMEAGGRMDGPNKGKPSSPATVRHVHALISQILKSAVSDGLVRQNVASQASPPSPSEARAPEFEVWTAEQSARFLAWSEARDDYLFLAWHMLLHTGLRRGELLALRWRDVDLERATIAVARSVHYIKAKGEIPVTGFTPPKSGKTRVVDIDAGTVARLRAHRESQSAVPEFVQRDALVLCNRFGRVLNPEGFSQQFTQRVAKIRETEKDLPALHVHGLRHTHATLLLLAGKHPKIVQERLGHATIAITLNTYSHVIPSLQREAADAIGALLGGLIVAPVVAPPEMGTAPKTEKDPTP